MNVCGVCYHESHGATAHGCPHCRGERSPAAVAGPVAPEPERPRLVMPERRVLHESARSMICPACGGAKCPHYATCVRCYRRLTESAKTALFRHAAYEQAVMDALEELGVTEPYWPEVMP